MKQTIAVGIDIGTSTTRVIVCEPTTELDAMPRVIGMGVAATKGMRHGYVISKEDVAITLKKALIDAEKESGHRIKSASLAIGGIGLASEYTTGSIMVTRADSIISKLDIEKCILDAETKLELKNKVILHAFPIMFKVDGKELPTRPEGMYGLKLEIKVLFITCFQQHLDDLLAIASDAGIKITSFTATPIATERLLLSDLQRNFGCALIDIGAETVSVSIFENSSLVSLHVFGIGSFDITKDIALGLRVTPDEAENIKLGVVGFQNIPKKKLDEIVEARLSDIFELVDKYFRKIGRSGLLPAGAIIIGGGAQIPMLEAVAKTMLKIPIKLGFLEFPTVSSASGIKTSKDKRALVAYGVATGSIDRVASKSNLQSSHDTDGFIATIKNFLRQLMP